jgi:hypothetical protein
MLTHVNKSDKIIPLYGNVSAHGYPDVLMSDKLEMHFLQIERFLDKYPDAADEDYAPDLDVLAKLACESICPHSTVIVMKLAKTLH